MKLHCDNIGKCCEAIGISLTAGYSDTCERLNVEMQKLRPSALLDRLHVLFLITIGSRPEIFELLVSIYTIATGVWWAFHFGTMKKYPAFAELLIYHGQPVWAKKMLVSGFAIFVGLVVRWYWFRVLALIWVGFLWALIAGMVVGSAPSAPGLILFIIPVFISLSAIIKLAAEVTAYHRSRKVSTMDAEDGF